MRLTNSVLETVITETSGEEVIPLVMKLKNTKNFSEFKLAEVLKQPVNITRNQLYRLLKYNLVGFIRRKDKRKGWYIYYWTFKLKEVRTVYGKLMKEKIEKLNDRLKRESNNNFYSCKNKCMRVSFESAVDFDFKCQECAELLELENNSETIKNIHVQLKEIEKFLKLEKF